MKQKLGKRELNRLEELMHLHLMYSGNKRKEIDAQMQKEFGVSTFDEAYRLLKENRRDAKEHAAEMSRRR